MYNLWFTKTRPRTIQGLFNYMWFDFHGIQKLYNLEFTDIINKRFK